MVQIIRKSFGAAKANACNEVLDPPKEVWKCIVAQDIARVREAKQLNQHMYVERLSFLRLDDAEVRPGRNRTLRAPRL